MAPKPIDPSVRFERLVDRSGDCHVFLGSKDRKGYGSFNRGNHRTVIAHRFAWEQEHGELDPAMCVLHHCDHPPCVRVEHLFLGTIADNNADMIAKGRYVGWKNSPVRRGEGHTSSKLTMAIAEQIRSEYQPVRGFQSELARRFGVSKSTIQAVLNGTRWTA